MDSREASRRVREMAFELGFDRVGIARVGDGAPAAAADLREWIARGGHAGMRWMASRLEEREHPALLLPGARAVVCVAVDYFTKVDDAPAAGCGRISQYARGADYHEILKDRLFLLRARVLELLPDCLAKVCVDTAPVLEKVWAARAGLGWQGKNTLLIDAGSGSWSFLGELLVTADLAGNDRPVADHCGTCTACLAACPTGALVAPGRLDGNRCISYLTIEHRGPLDPALRPGMGDWIFGCDECQTVCPFNRFARPTAEPAFQPRPGTLLPRLSAALPLDASEFSRRFSRSAVKRARRGGYLRNVAIALGNWGTPEAAAPLRQLLSDPDPGVREAAAWAWGRLENGTEQTSAIPAGGVPRRPSAT